MPLDPEQVKEVRSWLRKTKLDLRAARVDLAASPPLVEDALFHCQQAVEKALKAFLTWHSQPFRKTHSLEELGEACVQLDASLKACIDAAVPLTEYAWSLRYPGEIIRLTRREAKQALEIANQVAKEIRKRVPREARP